MISLHMLTLKLIVTMVAEFCSLVILIHNTLLREITTSGTWTTRVNQRIILLFHSTYWYISTWKDSSSLILWLLSYASSRRRRRWWKTWRKALAITHILHHNTTNYIFHAFFTLISLKVKFESENDEYPYIWFSMGIDHSNPYINSTTIPCDACTDIRIIGLLARLCELTPLAKMLCIYNPMLKVCRQREGGVYCTFTSSLQCF